MHLKFGGQILYGHCILIKFIIACQVLLLPLQVGMISLGVGARKANFQYENPHGFDQLVAAVKKYVIPGDIDAGRESESGTPGGLDNSHLAFQVWLVTSENITC